MIVCALLETVTLQDSTCGAPHVSCTCNLGRSVPLGDQELSIPASMTIFEPCAHRGTTNTLRPRPHALFTLRPRTLRASEHFTYVLKIRNIVFCIPETLDIETTYVLRLQRRTERSNFYWSVRKPNKSKVHDCQDMPNA